MRLDAQQVAGLHGKICLGGQRHLLSISNQCVLSQGSWLASSESIGAARAAIGEQRHVGLREEFVFTNYAVSALMKLPSKLLSLFSQKS